MPNLRWLFATLDNFIVRLLAHILPGGRTATGQMVASKYADVFYGVVTSALAVGLFLPMQPTTAGFAAPAPARPALTEVVEKYAPEVRLHPEERYFPSSVTWFLQRATVPLENKAHRFLHIPGDHREAEVRAGNLSSAKTYVHARKPSDGTRGLDIQYWFFFPYNGPLIAGPAGGAHEGDWEHITVRLDENWQQIKKVFFAAHDAEGRWHAPDDLQFRHQTHPVVYSARYGHASYPTAGLQSRGMLPADRTADGGATWQTWKSYRIVADPSGPRPEVAWLNFAGRWGRVGTLFSGPHGPAFQSYWTAETELPAAALAQNDPPK